MIMSAKVKFLPKMSSFLVPKFEPTAPPPPSPPQQVSLPVNMIVLVDGSDSIRSSNQRHENEWLQTLEFVTNMAEEMKLGERSNALKFGPDYFSLIQFSDNTKDHIIARKIGNRRSRKLMNSEILRAVQLQEGTQTYHALDHVLNLAKNVISRVTSFEENVNVLVIITDGESRDDGWRRANAIRNDLRGHFHFIIPVFVGQNGDSEAISQLEQFRGQVDMEVINVDDQASLRGYAVDIISQLNLKYSQNPNSFNRTKRYLANRPRKNIQRRKMRIQKRRQKPEFMNLEMIFDN
jgi:hypothetical protein